MPRIPKMVIQLAIDILIIVISTVKDVLENEKDTKHGTSGDKRKSG